MKVKKPTRPESCLDREEERMTELAHLYFFKYTEEERKMLRLAYEVAMNKAERKHWREACKLYENPENAPDVRKSFFDFFAFQNQISI